MSAPNPTPADLLALARAAIATHESGDGLALSEALDALDAAACPDTIAALCERLAAAEQEIHEMAAMPMSPTRLMTTPLLPAEQENQQ